MNEMTVGKSLEVFVEALQYHINSKDFYNFSQSRYSYSKLDVWVSSDL